MKKKNPCIQGLFMAPGLGFEPRYNAPEALVLPLDDPGMR